MSEAISNEAIPTQPTNSIAQAKTLKIASATIDGQQVRTIRASLGALKHDLKKVNGEMQDTSVVDLNEFSYVFAVPKDTLSSDKIKVELVIEPVPGNE